jgi:hypothetical protein
MLMRFMDMRILKPFEKLPRFFPLFLVIRLPLRDEFLWKLLFIVVLHFSINPNSSLFNEFVCKLAFFWHEWASFKGPLVPKKGQFTQERVEYKVFLFYESLKGSKSLKIFKISLTFCFDKLSNLSKSVHTGENSQILTVSNKKRFNSQIKGVKMAFLRLEVLQ